MRAAIYARKSTDQSDVHESETSIAHQRARCEEFITAKGWTVDERHVYNEGDGVSGALFGEGRPALMRLIEATKMKPRPFDCVVVYDDQRLGREMIETSYLVKQILDQDVRLFYSNGTERRLDSATDALLLSITNFGGAFEREQAARRVRDKMRSKASQGHSTGTVPLGYASVAVNSHKELVVDAKQAEIVRHIFTLSAQGNGISRIAHALNKDYPGLRKFSAPGVREMLSNATYIGQIVYGKKKIVVKGGKKIKVNVPASEWIKVEKPELRIVEQPLWDAVQKRKDTMFKQYLRGRDGRLNGRPEQQASQHLLSGLVTCGECGGRLVVWSKSASASRYRYLVCWRHRSGGDAACSNGRSVPLETLTSMLIAQLKNDVLTPARLRQVLDDLAADANAAPEAAAEKRASLEADARRVAQRLAKLTDAVAEGGPVKTLLDAIKVAES